MKKILMALAIVMTISLVAFGVVAYQGNKNIKGPNYNEDVHELLNNAIESCDYNEFIRIRQENNLPMKGRMFQVLNEDNFCDFKKMHEANEAGDFDKAQEIRTSLGLSQVMKQGNQKGQCAHSGNCETKQTGKQGKNIGGKFVDANNDGICDRKRE